MMAQAKQASPRAGTGEAPSTNQQGVGFTERAGGCEELHGGSVAKLVPRLESK